MPRIVEELRQSLSEVTSLPFLFIGSGFSRRYLDLPDWKGLIDFFAKEAHPEGSEFAYQLYKNEVDTDNLPQEQLLPLIAKAIEKDYTLKFLTDKKFASLREKYSEQINRDVSCLKIGIAEYFDSISSAFKSPMYQDEVESLKAIKGKVSGVVTTNYDTFLEYIFDDFESYVGQEELLFSQIYELAEIYKIHGCCSLPESLVVSADDYSAFNKKNAYLAAKLLTIFLEHPVIFIGYSLNDPNIRQILGNIVQCLNGDQLQKFSNRLFFLVRASDTRPESVIKIEKEFDGRTFGVTEIVRNDFSEIYNSIGLATPRYEPRILRALKKNLYELVTSNDPQGKLHVLDIEDTDNMDNVDFVMGVGAWQQIGDEGYVSLEPVDLFEDLLYDNRKYDKVKIVNLVLPKLLKMHSNSLPVFKYVQGLEGDLPQEVYCYVTSFSTFDSHLNATIRNKSPLDVHSILDVKRGYNLEDESGARKCLEEVVKLKKEEIIAEDLRGLLVEIYEFYPNMFREERKPSFMSQFRKAMKIYDWMVYCDDKK